jgi:hypothetical protein
MGNLSSGRFVNPNNSAFQTAVNSEIYVDKTGLLKYTNKVLGTKQAFICNSRPRRFGKSVTADMLTAYYSKGCASEDMFKNRVIGKDSSFHEHLNRYDVIHIDIQWCIEPAGSPENVVSYIKKNVIAELRTEFNEILPEGVTSLADALSRINTATGKKFIIIIDEWDVLIRDEADNQAVQDEYINFLRGLFKGTEPTKYIHLAYLTGILPIKKIKTQSALNNFDEFTMLNPGPFAEYFGFTENEVKGICNKANMNFNEMKRWYDGYVLKGMHVYNPKSVVAAVTYGSMDNYWTQTVAFESLRDYISMNYDGLRDDIVKVLAGERCQVNVGEFQNDVTSFKSKDDVLTVLIHLGYLVYDSENKDVFIPNEEVRLAFAQSVAGTDWTPVISALKNSDRLLKLTWNKMADEVAECISEVHIENTSILEYNDENALSCVIRLAYYNAVNDYTIIRELPSGMGFADIVFIPRKASDKPAMLVELKYNKDAQSAIRQIKEKKYVKSLEEYQGNLLLVGINYDKATKKHECVIEEYCRE